MPFIIHKEYDLPPDRLIVMGGRKPETPKAMAVPIPEESKNELPPQKRRGRPPKNRENKDNA